jgi:hypothetical protein
MRVASEENATEGRARQLEVTMAEGPIVRIAFLQRGVGRTRKLGDRPAFAAAIVTPMLNCFTTGHPPRGATTKNIHRPAGAFGNNFETAYRSETYARINHFWAKSSFIRELSPPKF